MTKPDLVWVDNFRLDLEHGYVGSDASAPRHHHPQLVSNQPDLTMLRSLRSELAACTAFTFSVAFVSPGAIALLKQDLIDFEGRGTIITSDYLSFNSPQAFAELLNLRQLGIEVRIHEARAFHPKGYIFRHENSVTAFVGSSNLTKAALTENHEWNLRVSAALDSDLGQQVRDLLSLENERSSELTQQWIDVYSATYRAPASRPKRSPEDIGASGLDAASSEDTPAEVIFGEAVDDVAPVGDVSSDLSGPSPIRSGLAADLSPATPPAVLPNLMQREALSQIRQVREAGERRAIVVSATGTGKTILSALEVKDAAPRRLLFLAHREQILEKTMAEYRRVLGGPRSDYGKLAGATRQADRKYVFAMVQTLSQDATLQGFGPRDFDYVIVDEAHRAGAPTYRRILSYLTPAFLLGLTATPERSDTFNVFELFDFNVPYEIRLGKALESGMLAPFHYYGVADVTFEDGTGPSDDSDLKVLIDARRVEHLLKALALYAQAGVQPRGLIFASRKAEAAALAVELDGRLFRGQPLRVQALTGDDTVPAREAAVRRLEDGFLDYIITVDVFNEGVDIPSVNQVVMLRNTQSPIVFVQQLGRGLRKAPGKEYLVVIDFIGNYTNNFMIPIALFGDSSLNKESVRKNMIAAEERGVLPGLSSVRFDKVSHKRVLDAIAAANLDSLAAIKQALRVMKDRVGGRPSLMDFHRFESADPVILATKRMHYPALLEAVLQIPNGLSREESGYLHLITTEVMTAKRPHEALLLEQLLEGRAISPQLWTSYLQSKGLPSGSADIAGSFDTLTLDNYPEAELRRYGNGVAVCGAGGAIALRSDVLNAYRENVAFRDAVNEVVEASKAVVASRYDVTRHFTVGRQYGRRDAARQLGWPRRMTSTIYGYRVDREGEVCPIFVTLHKGDEITESTAYEDALLSRSTMRWYTRSRRTLASSEVAAIVRNEVALHVFVKKDDAEGSDFFYLGRAHSKEAEQTTMKSGGQDLDVVRMILEFEAPIEQALYDYFHPLRDAF